MALTYLNYFAMAVGYITIAVALLIILFFIGLILREKYENMKWKKEQEKRRKEEEKKVVQQKEQTKEIPDEAVPEGIKVESTINKENKT